MTSAKRLALAIILGLGVVPISAYAVPVTLVAETNPEITSTCIYRGNPGTCSGIGTPAVLPGGSATDFLSAAYTVGQLRTAVGNFFQVDISLNQTDPLVMSKFELLIDSVVQFNLVPVPQNLNDTSPGNTAEYAIKGFNLSSFTAGQAAQFRISYSGEDAGPDLLFLQAVPEPTTVLLLASGFLGLAGWRRYARKDGADSRC